MSIIAIPNFTVTNMRLTMGQYHFADRLGSVLYDYGRAAVRQLYRDRMMESTPGLPFQQPGGVYSRKRKLAMIEAPRNGPNVHVRSKQRVVVLKGRNPRKNIHG